MDVTTALPKNPKMQIGALQFLSPFHKPNEDKKTRSIELPTHVSVTLLVFQLVGCGQKITFVGIELFMSSFKSLSFRMINHLDKPLVNKDNLFISIYIAT